MPDLIASLARANSNSRIPGLMVVGIVMQATELIKRLELIQVAAEDPRPFFREMAGQLGQLYRQQYAAGTGWGGADLHETGRLEQSLARPGGTENVQRLSRDSLFYGTRVPYAAPLKRGARGMPPRDPARLDRSALAERIQETAARTMTGTTRRLGI